MYQARNSTGMKGVNYGICFDFSPPDTYKKFSTIWLSLLSLCFDFSPPDTYKKILNYLAQFALPSNEKISLATNPALKLLSRLCLTYNTHHGCCRKV
jgi:hypothetical protein